MVVLIWTHEMNEILSIKLIHLNHNQDYYYVVVARNLNGETTSNTETFTTRKLGEDFKQTHTS